MAELETVRVLVVDDEEGFCGAVTEALTVQQDIHYQVRAATTSTLARRAIEKTSAPFDVFLIDQKLNDIDLDGIGLMTELLRASPESVAIVLTGFASREEGVRALQAGASSYIHKSANWVQVFDELTLQIPLLVESRRHQRESRWLHILTDIGQQFQSCTRRDEVADAIIAGALQLGFQQARLWFLFEEGESWLKGWKQLPAQHLPGFEDFWMRASDSPYTLLTLEEHKPRKFVGRKLGPSPLDALYPDPALAAQEGIWVDVPLWSEQRRLAKLSLFHYTDTRPLDEAALAVLQLYADQAATAYRRVELYERSFLSQQLTIHTQPVPRSESELDAFLEFIYAQVQHFWKAENFCICLLEPETHEMDFRLKFEESKRARHSRHPLKRSMGLSAKVALEGEPLRVTRGTLEFAQVHGVPHYGRPAQSWLGVPIRVQDQVLGVIALEDYQREFAYTQSDQRLLELIASQTASVLRNAQLSIDVHRSAQQLNALQYVSSEILQIAPASLNKMLQVVLTAVTASYGLGLNRAMLFLIDKGTGELRGRVGVGHLQKRHAERDWERDERLGMEFQKFLEILESGQLKPTPLGEIIPQLKVVSKPGCAFQEVIDTGKPLFLATPSDAKRLPENFVKAVAPAKQMVLVPLKAGEHVIGVLVVDNKFNGRPIDQATLDHLQTFVNQAALAIENTRAQRAQSERQVRELESLSQVHKAIMEIGSEADLPNVMNAVVQQASRALPNVSAITLYFQNRATGDLELGAAIGLHNEPMVRRGTPRPTSVVRRVLERDAPIYAVEASADPDLNGAFVERERIRSVAAFPLKFGNERIGCMFFNYREPHTFSESEKSELNLFAQQAALAIHKAILYDEAERRRHRFETVTRITRIISATLDPEEVVRAVLTEVRRVIPRTQNTCMLYLDAETGDLVFSPVSFDFYHIAPEERGRTRVSKDEKSIASRVARTGIPAMVSDCAQDPDAMKLIPSTQSELCVPIKVEQELLGVLVLESDQLNAFTQNDQRLLEALADQIAVALKKAHEHTRLRETQEDLAANSAIAWMGLFGSNWSHTVNQRTYEIEGKVALLRSVLKTPHSNIHKWLGEIEQACKQLKGLTIAGKTSRLPTPGKERVEIDRILQTQVTDWCNKHPQIVPHIELACEGLEAQVEKEWLEIALEKLVSNAIKAMDEKGHLTVRSMQRGTRIEVQVQDTGKGIPEEAKEFLLKQPVPKPSSKEGSGLGLLIARKVIKAYAGDLVLLQTAAGKGTTFMFYLPIAQTVKGA